ncbi:MAG: acyl-CoA dehydrogenase [Longimicrobiales bacterium]
MSAAADRLLLQFAPLIYVAWSDGILAEDELARITARLASIPGSADTVLPLVQHWLNPARRPSPAELKQLVTIMKGAARNRRVGKQRWFSLASLGQFLTGSRDQDQAGTSPELEALRTIEDALGVRGSAALNAVLGVQLESDSVQVAPEVLLEFMAGDRLAVRKQIIELLSRPECQLDPAAPTSEYRQRVLACCQYLADRGMGLLAYPPEYGGAGSVAQSIAAFETIAFHDLSLLVKYGVQFGLFGGSVLQLGTRQHHEHYLRGIGTFEIPGCFAMSETGHGSNVRDLETVASYDAGSREFVLQTPHTSARKDYIGNAALHGRMASVFAQLEVAGEQHGVHVFLVPLRDAAGHTLPGVTIEDCGLKAGLNGVDNGRISFQRVRIPRENLLNRFADVSEDGEYSSPIPSASRRFFTMLGTLVAGRISIACASCSVAKLALTIAVRYAKQRRQFGPEGGAEVPILSYQAMQHELLPRIATTYALDATLHGLVQRYTALATQGDQTSEEDAAEQREIEVLAASLKAYASWHGLHTVQSAREACGGAGYMFENRLSTLREDADIFTTFEGANVVLQQLVAKGLLSDYREQFGELNVWTALRFLTARASSAVVEQNPIVKRKTDREHLRDPEFHQAALRFREQRLLASVARRLKARLDDGLDSFAAMNACQEHLLSLAHAHAERVIMDGFRDRCAQCKLRPLQELLTRLSALFALHVIERDRAWFLESDYMEVGKTKSIRREVLDLCEELADQAAVLVSGFGIPDAIVRAPIAS